MFKRFAGRRRLTIAVGALLALAVAGGAFAYWTINGTGSGTVDTGTVTAITVNQTSTVTDLYPGGPAQALSGNFTNPNASAVKVGSVTAVVDPAWSSQTDVNKPACTAADFSITGTAAVNAEIPSGTSVGSWSGLSIQMLNSATNQDNCKNISTVPLLYSVDPYVPPTPAP